MKSTLSKLCRSCGECCKSLVLPVKTDDKKIFKEWIEARGGEIIKEAGGLTYVKLDYPCPHLQKNDDGWKCDWYNTDKYPDGCRIFDGRKIGFLKCKWKNLTHIVKEN